jgi:hypothetical protein
VILATNKIKNIKKIFAIISLIYCSMQLHAQCYDFYVQTPNNSNVKACSSGGYSTSQVQLADTYSRTFAIQVFDSGTNSYNCHGYAWRKKEGGSSVWINNLGNELNNLNVYWNDNSYYAYNYSSQTHADNLKVFYGNDDHTAITTSDPDVFISKMGCGCLVSHQKDNSPYAGGNFTYYKRNDVSISGSSLLCSGSSGTFYVSGAPSGYTWTSSSGLTAGSTSGYSKTFTGNTSDWVAGWVAVNLGSTELARKDVWVGKPYDIPSQHTVNMPVNTPTVITPSLTAYRQKMGITSFYWVWSQNTGGATLGSSYGATATVTIPGNGTYSLHAYGINSCGGYTTGAPMFIYSISRSYSSSYSMSAYPNPVSGQLNVNLEELETESTALSTSGSSISSSGGVSRAKPVYAIRLYNGSGTLVLQTTANDPGTVQLDVGSLPNGLYTLHVSDGSPSPPLTQHIVVSH